MGPCFLVRFLLFHNSNSMFLSLRHMWYASRFAVLSLVLFPEKENHKYTSTTVNIQLLKENLSHKRGKAYATMSKVIIGNGGFYGGLIEPRGVSAWWKKTEHTRVFVISRSLLLNHLKPQSSKA